MFNVTTSRFGNSKFEIFDALVSVPLYHVSTITDMERFVCVNRDLDVKLPWFTNYICCPIGTELAY